MRKTALLLFSTLLIVSLFFFSCVPQKKVNADKKQLEKLDSQLVQHSTDLKKLDEKKAQVTAKLKAKCVKKSEQPATAAADFVRGECD